MTIWVAAVHLGGGSRTEHINEVIWMDSRDHQSGKTGIAGMIDFITKHPGAVKVSDGKTEAVVEVVRGPQRTYLRSEADPSKTDNLLTIPRY
jgi:Protein of unknown function (DUF3892)